MSEHEIQHTHTGEPGAPGDGTATEPQATVDELAQRNADLRAQLEEQNATLEKQLAESRAASSGAEGLSDEDVRRIEHPEEFADDDRARISA